MQLTKGFEVEVYTGTPDGQIVGLSDRICSDLQGFMREPDNRNVEYTTPPRPCYDRLLLDLLEPRRRLRTYLQQQGGYTLIPGSTLALSGSDRFYRSDPTNPYHDFIEKTYGTTVVTASIHINIGLSDPETILKACRLVRLEAPLYLALSASSPFLNGQVTGSHSSRWQLFPKTPSEVPLFESHAHFIRWTEDQLAVGSMQNVRHLWSAVRPNGDRRPYKINRLELRICDLVVNPLDLLAITALLEARIQQLLEQPNLDPLIASQLTPAELVQLSDANEVAAARHSLDATLQHWQDGRAITARDWIESLYETVFPLAKTRGYSCFLLPIQRLLRDGNLAQQWLRQVEAGATPEAVMVEAIATMAAEEQELAEKIYGVACSVS
ncbi:glutamate--cysteine ligase [Synechococcus elongatus]|uniref:Glutamate--cysteine ligase n=1 Tax=Synechococcus elongatus PCC 11801 TaxID=2219813 RepID=A0AAN1UVD4_SYNEL|nr:glutamate--cysteine ligase [Synechococcus elongatus]AZB73629.1 putative glutamate--cysteine ligase [Synechococcus elongatus PCC 11801]